MSQKVDYEHLTQQQAATIFNVDVRTLRRWEAEHREKFGFPRNADGSYHAHALMWWCMANKIHLGR
jgi:hypothetical protein